MLTALVIVFFALLALVLAVALADRLLAGLAERRAGEYLAGYLGAGTTVRIHGTPFLNQAVRGRYADVEIVAGGVQIGEIAGATLNAHLYTARVSLRELLERRVTQVVCDHVEGRLALTYGELARVSRIPGLTLNYRAERLVASAALPLPGINQLARISGEAVLTVVGASSVWLRVRGVSVAGISVPRVVINQLLPSLNVPIPLPALPYGLHLDRLTPEPSGLVVSISARDVVFVADPRPQPTGNEAGRQ